MALAPLLISLYVSVSYVAAIHLWSKKVTDYKIRRDDPKVIKTRMRRVVLATVVNLALVPFLNSQFSTRGTSFKEGVLELGLIPGVYSGTNVVFDFHSFLVDSGCAFKLACILYCGPLLDNVLYYVLVPGVSLREAVQDIKNELCDIWGVRNYVFGPITEELFYTSMLVNSFLLTSRDDVTYSTVLLLPPLFFGLAHLHHGWEMYTLGIYSVTQVVSTALLQMTYTTLFGIFTNFVYIRTGRNFWCCCLLHSFANYMGLPKMSELRDQLEAHHPSPTSALFCKLWKWSYVALLFIGIIGFKNNLWGLTDSKHAIEL
ncbi:CAAX prenyl protease [Lachancea thermotolerans CBS 6340]|uniref:intramembrane prenyl-peptidase Rce1 n=1 Tax=Lachancea thermotolerans (strain ATCC 56472 / CBS 6340 / NRRL Y-8284) TaxID=559295 RepID=C5DDV2_LACTC|nr:KLTH0C04026p [Lachancea thermotolerans CBS 6340]CAR21963.1 KLTH0C04026p [Lachancea thermotolerans CBS 6340]